MYYCVLLLEYQKKRYATLTWAFFFVQNPGLQDGTLLRSFRMPRAFIPQWEDMGNRDWRGNAYQFWRLSAWREPIIKWKFVKTVGGVLGVSWGDSSFGSHDFREVRVCRTAVRLIVVVFPVWWLPKTQFEEGFVCKSRIIRDDYANVRFLNKKNYLTHSFTSHKCKTYMFRLIFIVSISFFRTLED